MFQHVPTSTAPGSSRVHTVSAGSVQGRAGIFVPAIYLNWCAVRGLLRVDPGHARRADSCGPVAQAVARSLTTLDEAMISDAFGTVVWSD